MIDERPVGLVYRPGLLSQAEERALQECGAGCTVVIWFRNACAALAVGAGYGYGSGWAGNRYRAESIALGVCRQHTGNCSIATWVCTTR